MPSQFLPLPGCRTPWLRRTNKIPQYSKQDTAESASFNWPKSLPGHRYRDGRVLCQNSGERTLPRSLQHELSTVGEEEAKTKQDSKKQALV